MKIGNYRITRINNEVNPILLTLKMARTLLYMNRVFEEIGKRKGVFVECGIGKGRTFAVLAILAALEGRGRKLFGFDSFVGFPEPSQKDNSPRLPKKGDWNTNSVALIRKRLAAAGISLAANNTIEIIPGFFNDTLPVWNHEPIALLHLDVDLHDSYAICLEKLYPRVVSGGAILFDEYKDAAEKWPGAVLAIDKFLINRKLSPRRDGGSGKYYVIKP